MQAVHLGNGMDLAHRLADQLRHIGPSRRRLLQQPGHALQVVLDPVVHLFDQQLALRHRRLEARLLGQALLGHVAADQQHLGLVAGIEPDDAHVPNPHRHGHATFVRRQGAQHFAPQRFGAPLGQGKVLPQRPRIVGAEPVLGRVRQHLRSGLADEGRGHLVQAQDSGAAGVEQGNRQRRGVDDALQRGLRLGDADLGLAAPLDVQQREGDLAATGGDR